VPQELVAGRARLLQASLASSTWQKYMCGWRAFRKFEEKIGVQYRWPLSKEALRNFAVFMLESRKVKANSVRAYLASLACLHKLRGWHNYEIKDWTINAILKGGTNLMVMNGLVRSSRRRVVTVALLRIIGSRLSRSGWSGSSRQTVWAACLLAFFGTFRMGELLASRRRSFDSLSTLTWGSVKYREDGSYLIHIKMPKSGRVEGEFVDIFQYSTDSRICPVRAMMKQKTRQKEMGLGREEDPVFAMAKESFLTKDWLNDILRSLLGDLVDYNKDSISGHSFRAGLPSLIAKNPDLMSSQDIQGWGRWSSEAYQCYTRLRLDQKRQIFDKIVQVMDS